VLRTVADRPGVTSGELADATGIKRTTLSTLLGRLTRSGELEQQEQPSGLRGYSLARSTAANGAPTLGSDEQVSAPAATGESDAPTTGQRAENAGPPSGEDGASTATGTEDPAAPNASDGA
jgi:DNA-binding IclR family transcriptional regulator